MEAVRRLKLIIKCYFVILGFLLLAVTAMPLVIQGGITIARDMIIGEEILETCLILLLFGVSFFILKGIKHTLEAYQHAVEQSGQEKSRLISSLAEAFHYIGTVNVEFQNIQSILCGVEQYPQTKKEFKLLFNRLASHAMAIAASEWLIIRIIERSSGRTVSELSVQLHTGALPCLTAGNRAILDGHRIEGHTIVRSRQKNLDLQTVCILPETTLSGEQLVLLTAIVNQVEMLYLLGCPDCIQDNKTTPLCVINERKPYHDHHN